MKQFIGEGQEVGGCDVWVTGNGDMSKLDHYRDEVNHSPDGFQWGYCGSGPAQLAYALLRELESEEFAKEHYQDFKDDFVASLEGGTDFVIEAGEIKEWIETHA